MCQLFAYLDSVAGYVLDPEELIPDTFYFRGLGDRSFGIIAANSEHHLVYHQLCVDSSNNIDVDNASGRQGRTGVVLARHCIGLRIGLGVRRIEARSDIKAEAFNVHPGGDGEGGRLRRGNGDVFLSGFLERSGKLSRNRGVSVVPNVVLVCRRSRIIG